MVGLVIGIVVTALTVTVVLAINGNNSVKKNQPKYRDWELYNKEEENERD